jgi:hypothetical protein
MSTNFTETQVLLPMSLVKDTERLLNLGDSMETVVYWFGRIVGGGTQVLNVVRPAQTRSWTSFDVSAKANADVTAFACERELRLVAQLHSHPGRYVGHSPGDDRGAPFVFQGFYSIVVPLYGIHGILPLTMCGVHVYEAGFRRLTRAQVNSTFQILSNANDNS